MQSKNREVSMKLQGMDIIKRQKYWWTKIHKLGLLSVVLRKLRQPLDAWRLVLYNMGVFNETRQMSTAQETVQGIVIDVCTRTFLLLSDQGSERLVECETVQEFMNVLEVVTANLDPDQIEYADLAVYGEENN